MTFLDKLGIKGKKNKASQPMGDEKKRNLERQVRKRGRSWKKHA